MFRPLAILATAAALAVPGQAAATAHHTPGAAGVRTAAGASIVTDNKDPDRLTFLPEIDDTVLVVRAVP